MLEVYLFNPDNDLALANGDENYTPPLSARKMADDLSLLPIWYTSPGMLVMSNEPDAEEWMLQIRICLIYLSAESGRMILLSSHL